MSKLYVFGIGGTGSRVLKSLVMLLANHMKKLIYQINNEDVEDAKIFKDMAYYSHGAIRLDPQTHHLHEYQIVKPAQPVGKKKKKK